MGNTWETMRGPQPAFPGWDVHVKHCWKHKMTVGLKKIKASRSLHAQICIMSLQHVHAEHKQK